MTNVDIINTNSDMPAFTPSLGLRYWMNKMKRTASVSKPSTDPNQMTTTPSMKEKTEAIHIIGNGVHSRSILNNNINNDTQSAVSISGITTSSYFGGLGSSSMNGYDIDSSLRVLHQGGTSSSERSSFLSDDIQSNASIKSKPWISQLIQTQQHELSKHEEGELSSPLMTQQRQQQQELNILEDEEEEDDDADNGVDGDIFGSNTSFSSSYDHQAGTSVKSLQITNNQTGSKQRRWSENEYSPPLGSRIKAGLGRLMGRELSPSTSTG